MYTVDQNDEVLALDGLPQCSVGAPLPLVLCNEHATLVAYIVEEHDPNWDGKTFRLVGPESDGELIAIVRFVDRCAIMFGPPNDEAFAGHPLASRGLESYGVFHVLHSSWIRALEGMNSIHPCHRPERYAELRHFILSFHDSTLECVAKDIKVVETFRGSMDAAAKRLVELLTQRS